MQSAANRHRTSSVLSDGSPADKHDKCYYILVLVGTGLLLPWNAVLTAFDYFATTYGSWTNLSVPLLNQAANLVFMLLMVKYGAQFSFTRRIVGTLMIYVVCLVAIPILSLMADSHKVIAIVLTFLIFVILGATCAVLQASLFGMCGSLPPEYTNAIMSGSAISGVLMNVLMMVTKGLLQKYYTGHSDENTDRIEAFVFFGFSAVFVVLCIFGYLYVVRKPFIQHHVAHLFSILDAAPAEDPKMLTHYAVDQDVKSARPSDTNTYTIDDAAAPRSVSFDESDAEQPRGTQNGTRVHKSYSQDQMLSEQFSEKDANAKISSWATGEEIHASPNDYSLRKLMEPARRRQRSSTMDRNSRNMDSGTHCGRTPSQDSGPQDLEQPFVGTGEGKSLEQTDDTEDLDIEATISVVLAKVRGHGIAVMSVFFISLYIFPGFLTVLCASGFWGTGKDADTWMRLVLLTAFNVTDLAGRLLAPGIGTSFFAENTLFRIYGLSFIRLALVPVAWLCVLGSVDTVYLPGIMTLVLGFSNGCLGSLCMMYAPQMCESHEQELAGTIMSVFLMLGITTGALGQDAMTPVFNWKDFGNCHD